MTADVIVGVIAVVVGGGMFAALYIFLMVFLDEGAKAFKAITHYLTHDRNTIVNGPIPVLIVDSKARPTLDEIQADNRVEDAKWVHRIR